tara:strand:- start:1814 stop:2308 length:495 start_codon:yes stop_codon:yes gene_type:complete
MLVASIQQGGSGGPSNLYAESDAADPNNETNTVSANWDPGNGDYSFTSVSTSPTNGSYHISYNRLNTGVEEWGVTISGLTVGVPATILYDARCNSTSGSTIVYLRTANGWTSQVGNGITNDDTWNYDEELTGTPTATTVKITFKFDNGGTAGDYTWIDNIRIAQ